MLRLKNRFVKGKGINKHPFDEPTFLSFFLMFDYTSSASPLFNGRAADFLEKVLGEEAKAEKLRRFTKYLKRFNKEMPWMWQSITGVQGAYEYKDLKDPYRFSDGGVLEIECLETLDFTVAGMFDIYRRCVVDVERMVQILPNNLREFQMFVYVQEIRNFVPFIGVGGEEKQDAELKSLNNEQRSEAIDIGAGSGALNLLKDRLDSDILDWKSKNMGPRFVGQFKYCRFDWASTSKMFEELTNKEIGTEVRHKIKINFKKSKVSDYEYLNHYQHSEPFDPFSLFDGDLTAAATAELIKSQAQQAGSYLASQAETAIASNIKGKIEDIKNKLLLGNVYGANFLSNAQDVLNAGSINAIKPMLKKEDPREIVNAGVNIGSTIYPPSAPEVNLENTKIYEGTLPETPLQSTNIYPPKSSEQDSDNLGNALNDG